MSSLKKAKDVWKSKAACDKAVEGSKSGDEQEEDNKKTSGISGSESENSAFLGARPKLTLYLDSPDPARHFTDL